MIVVVVVDDVELDVLVVLSSTMSACSPLWIGISRDDSIEDVEVVLDVVVAEVDEVLVLLAVVVVKVVVVFVVVMVVVDDVELVVVVLLSTTISACSPL